MIKRILAGIAAAGIAVTAFAVPASASARPVNWTQRTCSAFARWQAKPTTANLDRLVTFSLHLPPGYLPEDAARLLAAEVGPKPKPADVDGYGQEVAWDCFGGL